MIRFQAEVLGVPVLDRAFNRIDEYISDLRSVWPSVSREFYAIELEQFESQGAAGASGRWAPLSDAYARFKVRAFPGEPILQATHALKDSMTSPDALDSIFIPEPQQLTIGSKREGARAHQRGGGRLPARPIISLTEAQKRRIQKAIQSELVRFTRQLGFQVDERAA